MAGGSTSAGGGAGAGAGVGARRCREPLQEASVAEVTVLMVFVLIEEAATAGVWVWGSEPASGEASGGRAVVAGLVGMMLVVGVGLGVRLVLLLLVVVLLLLPLLLEAVDRRVLRPPI